MRGDGYAAASRNFLAKAEEELQKEDLFQASEKLWGAAAQMVKTVVETRGWRHDSHRALVQVVNRLAQETNDPDLRNAFLAAQGLHFNFYEDVHPREFVQGAVGLIREFVAKLERLQA